MNTTNTNAWVPSRETIEENAKVAADTMFKMAESGLKMHRSMFDASMRMFDQPMPNWFGMEMDPRVTETKTFVRDAMKASDDFAVKQCERALSTIEKTWTSTMPMTASEARERFDNNCEAMVEFAEKTTAQFNTFGESQVKDAESFTKTMADEFNASVDTTTSKKKNNKA